MSQLPNLEIVAAKVHEAWMQTKRAQGVTTRLSETGEELMVPYAQLSEPAKELDRMTVRTVYAAIEALSS
jgi:predicted SPOUT superfamily RNA methylase MTH1